ncbi:Extracellular xylan exo-alpha-(1-_2)-glucuronosidase precursor [Vibrio aerogenes CECT 7868]|uniref:Xylan alpha-1,2-glucuronidase n=1 Tax=Vibrio aerogenes CECT 7868 TaxID=1216006 RepID=A0A1M5V9G7_9VIBR|nr:alpha-glucuronidase family glycosyl hydrolase [Vibrio aerogenes]SHH71734.1 Extracellular xylan exo-alpha-(1->2)-glucuronosidase precursor [Vibrio aerogenes CECT 7868]
MKKNYRTGRRFTGYLLLVLLSFPLLARSILTGEDGYRLWLKYDPISSPVLSDKYRHQFSHWQVLGESQTLQVVRQELDYAFRGLLGKSLPVARSSEASLIIGRLANLPAPLRIEVEQSVPASKEGYLIKTIRYRGKTVNVITAKTDIGALYGTFRLLRQLQTLQSVDTMHIASEPKLKIRVLDHWDNLNRHVERGYAGQSIWDWHKLPEYIYQRYYDYARANASVGINGTVLNNVNADPLILTPRYLDKVTALADVFRPYGIRVYLSVKFSAPQLTGGLKTSDPLDPAVRQWWKNKARDIYQKIPDFGGFLVKANSEGQPGPGDFGRTHAEGANMLADALAPYGGIVMWRAFVYANEKHEERSKQAYSEFKPLDGQFRDNVLLQVKNGPVDFQPREPVSPLFGATPNTSLMMEFQITMEYLGFSTHAVYLGPLYKEVLETDTYAKGQGSTVAKVIDGSLFGHRLSGIAGVSDIGSDRNWTGHILLQANWYVFGRLAWDHTQSAAGIAGDWIKMTLTHDEQAVAAIEKMMMASREVTVNYMTPLGLHHIMGTGHHYGPGPWVDSLPRDDWNPVYYHKADQAGIGFDRSPRGVNAVEQYFSPLREQLSDPQTTPEKFLLWFHHLPWDYKIPSSGRTLWNELVHRYYQGAADVKAMAAQWDHLQDKLDPLQFEQVRMAFVIQQQEAEWWRDACVLYFQQFSGQPLPDGLEKPHHTLAYYEQLSFPYAPGQGGK